MVSEMRPWGRGHLSLFREDGGWETSMEPRRFPAPKPDMAQSSFWQKLYPAFQASASRTRVCRPPSPLCRALSEGRTHPLCCLFFFFLVKSQLKFGYFSPIASPAKTFSRLRPLHVDLPSLSQQPLREPPQHVTNCYVSFLRLPFLWHQRLNKSAPFRVNVGQQPGEEEKS